jgi:hypothetical protein
LLLSFIVNKILLVLPTSAELVSTAVPLSLTVTSHDRTHQVRHASNTFSMRRGLSFKVLKIAKVVGH